MQIQNDFVVEAPLDAVWNHVLDVGKVAPCMPGAELTETIDATNWKGKVAIKLGPVSMSFAGTVTMTERDDATHHVVLKADGREQRGRGAASALVTANMEAIDDGNTKVAFTTDLTITGAAAQYGRGMIQDISSKLTGEFATCLKANIGAEADAAAIAVQAAAAPPAPPAGSGQGDTAPPPAPSPQPTVRYTTAKPVKGVRLGLWAMWQSVVRFVKGIFGGAKG